jgi:hypothetical protein
MKVGLFWGTLAGFGFLLGAIFSVISSLAFRALA